MSANVIRVPEVQFHFHIDRLHVGLQAGYTDARSQKRRPQIDEPSQVPLRYCHNRSLMRVYLRFTRTVSAKKPSFSALLHTFAEALVLKPCRFQSWASFGETPPNEGICNAIAGRGKIPREHVPRLASLASRLLALSVSRPTFRRVQELRLLRIRQGGRAGLFPLPARIYSRLHSR